MSITIKQRICPLDTVDQLHSMLINHSDRPRFLLNVLLKNRDGLILKQDSFDIFAYDPESKIKEKVGKMKHEGGMFALNISEIIKVKEKEYTLILSI